MLHRRRSARWRAAPVAAALKVLRRGGAGGRHGATLRRPGRRRRGSRGWRGVQRGFQRVRLRAERGGFLAAPQDVGGLVLIGGAERVVGGHGEITGAEVAILGLFGHAARDHRVERPRDARAHGAGLRDGLHQVGGDQRGGAVGLVRRGTGEALVQHAGQRVDVGAVGDLVVGEAFGGHVFPGADRGAQLGEFFVGGGAGDPEVDQIGEVVAGHQDVGRFDVAVHDAGGVRGVQRRGDLGDDGDRARRGQRAEPFEQRVQVDAFDEAHLQEHLPVDFAVVVDGHHVGFLKTTRDAGFALHPLAVHRVFAEGVRHQLDGDGPFLDGVLGLVDLAHAAAAQQPFQAIRAERRPHPRVLRVAHPADIIKKSQAERPASRARPWGPQSAVKSVVSLRTSPTRCADRRCCRR